MKLILTFLSAVWLAATLVELPVDLSGSGLLHRMSLADERRTPNRWIIDSADVLTPREERRLNSLLSDLNRRTTIEMVGLTTGSLHEATIEEYGLRIASKMRIGINGVNNGVLVILAPNDRRIRIEVGRGMEWQVSDSMAAAIIEETIPHLRAENYHDAFETIFETIAQLNNGIAWNIRYRSIADVLKDRRSAPGHIVRFDGTIGEIGEHDAMMVAAEGTSLRLLFTEHVDRSPSGLQEGARRTVHARVVSVEPLVVQLLQVEPSVDEGNEITLLGVQIEPVEVRHELGAQLRHELHAARLREEIPDDDVPGELDIAAK